MVTFSFKATKTQLYGRVYDFKLPEGSSVLSDQMVLIGTTQNRAENYFRLLKVMDSKGNVLHLITNRFDLSAEEISEMYKSRWTIELFLNGSNNISISKILRSKRMGDSKSSVYCTDCLLLTYPRTNRNKK